MPLSDECKGKDECAHNKAEFLPVHSKEYMEFCNFVL